MPRPALKQLLSIMGSQSSTVTTVASSTSSVLILAANVNRAGATIFNASTAVLYLKLSTGSASSSSYTLPMGSGSYLEVPFTYAGEINGAWVAADGMAFVSEFY